MQIKRRRIHHVASIEQTSDVSLAQFAEMAQLVATATHAEKFQQSLLDKLLVCCDATNAAMWRQVDEVIQLQCEAGLDQQILFRSEVAQEQHSHLIARVMTDRQPRTVPVTATMGEDANGRDSYSLLLFPVVNKEECRQVLEVIRRGGEPTNARTDGIELLSVAAQFLVAFERTQRADLAQGNQHHTESVATFTQRVHDSLDPRRVAYCIANDGRYVLGCDRLTVLLRHGRHYRAIAVSGQDRINHRANAVAALERLAKIVLATGEAVSFAIAKDQKELPPVVESALDQYIDQSNSKQLLVVPLESDTQSRRRHLGALIAEQFSGKLDASVDDARTRTVVEHSSTALANAQQHQSVFLLPLFRTLGRMTAPAARSKLLLCGLLVVAVVAALLLVQTDFVLVADGTLEPLQIRHVYAPDDGIVTNVFVSEGQSVQEATPLAAMHSPQLDIAIEEIIGQMQTTSKKLAALRASRLATHSNNDADPAYERRSAAEEEELSQWMKSLQKQHDLLRMRRAALEVRSPIAGSMITWQAAEALADRPVSRGQRLLTVAQLDGPWIVELQLDDNKVGHFLEAQQSIRNDLSVSFVLATQPELVHSGRVADAALSTELIDGQSPVVLVRVAIDRDEISTPRPSASATGRIHCGRRCLGYVWFHEVIEFVQSRVLFRL